jgi:UDP-glucose 4-epimerase
MTCCVIGRHGLIGSAIARQLGEVSSFPTADTRVLFHFGSPSHQAFEQNPNYHARATMDSYANLLPYCCQRGILFVYPSSALVYEKDTPFVRHKQAMEAMVRCYDCRTLGCRIFPVYGPGENRSVIAQWCRAMLAGERPVVYGDGTQARDFTYADDAARAIIEAAEGRLPQHALVDIGSGERISFNAIVRLINRELGVNLEPRYVPAPEGYSTGIVCRRRMETQVSIEEGIRRVLASIKPHYAATELEGCPI